MCPINNTVKQRHVRCMHGALSASKTQQSSGFSPSKLNCKPLWRYGAEVLWLSKAVTFWYTLQCDNAVACAAYGTTQMYGGGGLDDCGALKVKRREYERFTVRIWAIMAGKFNARKQRESHSYASVTWGTYARMFRKIVAPQRSSTHLRGLFLENPLLLCLTESGQNGEGESLLR